jgi:hypothetical protein
MNVPTVIRIVYLSNRSQKRIVIQQLDQQHCFGFVRIQRRSHLSAHFLEQGDTDKERCKIHWRRSVFTGSFDT